MTCPPEATGGAAATGAGVGAGGDVGTITVGIAVATAIAVAVGIMTRVEVAGMAVLVATGVAVFEGACVGDRVGNVVGACVAVAAAIAMGEFAITVGGMGVFDGDIDASMRCVAVAASVGWVMTATGVAVAALQPINKLNTTNGQYLFTCFIISMNLSSFYQTFDGKKPVFDHWAHSPKYNMPRSLYVTCEIHGQAIAN